MRPTIDARTGLETIAPDECRRLLASDEIGRLAIVDGGTPAVFPVNYVYDGEAIVVLAVIGPVERFPGDLSAAATRLLDAASRLSANLGFTAAHGAR